MAANNAFEPDSIDETATVPVKRASNNTPPNQLPPNETTSLNVQVDTYFSDEKVQIPDNVMFTSKSHLNSIQINHSKIHLNVTGWI